MNMKKTETITTAEDILALVDYICSQKTDITYKLCNKQEIRLLAEKAPEWIVPVKVCDLNSKNNYQTKYFIFNHELCSLTVQTKKPEKSPLMVKTKVQNLPFHHWIIKDETVKTVFATTQRPLVLPNHWVYRCFNEHQAPCQVLFLTPQDILDGFPFRQIVKEVKNIELKVTSYDDPVWLLTQNTGKEYIIYPCSLHRFCDELNITHNFGKQLRTPQTDEEFLVAHETSKELCSLFAFKVKSSQELSILRFSELNLQHKIDVSALKL